VPPVVWMARILARILASTHGCFTLLSLLLFDARLKRRV
jgi:hypothetical protein